MSLVNIFKFTENKIKWNEIEKATHNQYRVVSVRPFTDKKGMLPEGYNLTLMVLKDDYDYGCDKNGVPRENNVFQNFDVTVLSRKSKPKKGDMIRLQGFDDEHSYVIGFDLLLRFKECELINVNEKA